MQLTNVPKVSGLTKDAFLKNYYKPQKPVVITDAIANWPAYTKWNFDYIREVAGTLEVPLYDDRPVSYKEGFNEPHARMLMNDYIDLLEREPTKYRIFLWNLLKEVPALQQDFEYPDFGLRLFKTLPMLFFGGTSSYTFMHYDIDLANIFHFHFQGQKEVLLFPQNQTPFLYAVPHSLITREDIDFSNPDYKKWPALKKASGFKATLTHGDVLYMPEGYWHYMQYITPGFSMSLRSLAKKPKNLSKALYNIFIMRYFDNVMRRLKGEKWITHKNEAAITNTHKKLNLF